MDITQANVNTENNFLKMTQATKKLIHEKIKFVETRYNINWFKVKQKNSGINMILEEIRDENNLTNDAIIVKRWHPDKGQYWALASLTQLKELIKKNNFIYETLEPRRRKKVYFDIDSVEDNLEDVKNIILSQFPDANLQISGYITEAKSSFHIILSNYYCESENIHYVKGFCKMFKDYGFDSAVYGRYNVFKCINQSKCKKHSPIQAYIEGSKELSKHLILHDFDDDCESINTLNWDSLTAFCTRDIIKDNYDLLKINPSNDVNEIPEDFDLANSKTVEKLNVIPNKPKGTDNSLEHEVIFKIMIWAKKNGSSFEEFWNWNKQKENTVERLTKYSEYWKSCDNYKCEEGFINTLLFKFYPFLKEDKTRQRFRQLNELKHTKIINGDFLQGQDISVNIKYSYLDIRMGGNKTGAVIDFIKKHSETNSEKKITNFFSNNNNVSFKTPAKTIYNRIMYVSPRVALSNDIIERMKKEGLTDFKIYNDKSIKDKLKTVNHIIMSINSIFKIEGETYDLVIIDEIETVWDGFNGKAETQQINGVKNWKTFMHILRKAKKVIVMDALLCNKSVNVLTINDKETEREVITLTKKQEERYFHRYNSREFEYWRDNIVKHIEEGKKVFIFMPYKGSLPGQKREQLISCEAFQKYLCNKFGFNTTEDVIKYTSDDKQNKDNLRSIEEIWSKAKCIIANTSIAVGVNYPKTDSYKIFGYYTSWVGTRDFIQSLYRIRYPTTKIIDVIYEKSFPQRDIYKPFHFDIIDDESFEELKRCFKIESRTSSKDKLNVCANRTNIIMSARNRKDDRTPSNEELCGDDFYTKWEDIPDITIDEYKRIRSKLLTGYDTVIDRLKIEKFEVILKFKNIKTAEMFFYNRTLLDRFEELQNANHLLHKIVQYNGIESFFHIEQLDELQLSTLKIPGYITNDELKHKFDFRNPINKRDITLLARIMNAFFGRVFTPITTGKDKDGKTLYKTITDSHITAYELDENLLCHLDFYLQDSKALEMKFISQQLENNILE